MFCQKKSFALLILVSMISSVARAGPIDAWMGRWQGECQLIPAFQGVESFGASLEIAQSPLEGEFRWKIIYEANGNLPRQVRDYVLKTINEENNHYVIDERNGIFLDTFLSGNVMYSPFRINGKLITATYNLTVGESIVIDMPSFEAEPLRKTCLAGNPSLCAESFELRVAQRCTLRKSPSADNANTGEAPGT